MRLVKILLAALMVAFLAIGCVSCSGSQPPEDDRACIYYHCYGDYGMMNEDEINYLREEFHKINPGEIEINPGDTFRELEVPSLPGYEFIGWFERSEDSPEPIRWVEGTPLPTDRYVYVEAMFEKVRYNINIYVEGEFAASRECEGVTNLLNYNLADPQILENGYDSYFHNGITLIGNSADNERVAEIYSEKYDIDIDWQYLYWMEIYTDPEMTKPLTSLKITEETNLYEKYIYSPVRYNYFEDETCDIIGMDWGMEVPDGVLIIPSKISNLTVVGISDGAFANYDYVEVVIMDGIKTIGENAFAGSSIGKVYIPDSITSIGRGAFANCENLVTVDIRTTKEFDFESIFEGSDNIRLDEYEGAYYFGNYFIQAVDGATTVKIKDGCAKIPASAFENSGIEEIIIPASVTEIGEAAFKNSSLKRVTLNGRVDNIAREAFAGTDITEINIPSTVITIGEGAFRGTSLASVTIPASVKTIGVEAFAGTLITEITIPATVTSLGNGAFKDCALLVNCTINTEASFSFSRVFTNCTSIVGEEYGNAYYYGNEFIRPVSKDITWARIKSGCTTVPENAFKDCTKLSKVYLPKSVKYVETYAFYNVNSLYFACYIESYSSSQIQWGYNALATIHPTSGADMVYQKNQFPVSVLMADNGIAYSTEHNLTEARNGAVIYGCFTDAAELTIEESYNTRAVKLIYPNAFMDNTTLKKLTVNNCEIVGSAAFWNATALEEVNFKTCLMVGIRAFYGCTSLEKVSFETKNLQFIGMKAFEGCTALDEVKVDNDLTAWNSALTATEAIAANTNIAAMLKGDKVDWHFADTDITEEEMRAFASMIDATNPGGSV